MNTSQLKTGSIYALTTYFLWGFFPLFWKLLAHVPVLQLLAYRIIWAFVFYTLIIAYKNRKLIFISPSIDKHRAGILTVASVILMINWMIYIYAVNSGQIVESSLGYFINPLINMIFGVWFFKEKMNRNEFIASVLAGIGVAIITWDQGHLPWVALSLALTFGLYGALKKKMSQMASSPQMSLAPKINPTPQAFESQKQNNISEHINTSMGGQKLTSHVEANTSSKNLPTNNVTGTESNHFESLVLLAPAMIFIITQDNKWIHESNALWTGFLLVCSGILTGLPLIFFAEALKRIPYYLMGFFQFIAPTLQFATGVLIFKEPLSAMKLNGFIFIWTSILFLLATKYSQYRKYKKLTKSY